MIRYAAATAAAALLSGAAFAQTAAPVDQCPPNVPEFTPAFPQQTRAPAVQSETAFVVETVTEGLVKPWSVAVLPDGAMLVTELAGDLRVVVDGTLRDNPVAGLPEVHAVKQGGLLDVEPGPTFAEDRLIYWTYSKPMGGDTSATAAARGRLSEDMSEVTGVTDIFVQTPASDSPLHYGSRLAFDDAGHVFITTGEHSVDAQRTRAQDVTKTYGKVIRVNLDGGLPADNPFADQGKVAAQVWSYGHRNIQSAAINPETGALWIGEHGPKGGDEINLIEAGANYGWPLVSYGEDYDETPVGEGGHSAEGLVEPRYYWDPVIAPGGMTFYDGAAFPEWQGDILIAGLKGEAIVRLVLNGDTVVGEERLLTDHGRIRDVTLDADGAVLALVDHERGSLLRLAPTGVDGEAISN